MIEPLQDLPTGIIGFRASGTVEASDSEGVLTPAIDAAFDDHDKINLVFVLAGDFDHLSLGAMLEGAKLISMPREAWGRAAFVTNDDVLTGIATVFGGLVPGDFRVFPLDKQDEAVAWVAEGAQDEASG